MWLKDRELARITWFRLNLSGGILIAEGESPHEKEIDTFPVDLCPGDHAGLSRGWRFERRYPAPAPIPILQLRAKMQPATRLSKGLQ